MPEEKIYLSDKDLEVLKKAQELLDKEIISQSIAKILKQKIKAKKAEKKELKEIELEIGIFTGTLSKDRVKNDTTKKIKFYGRRLASYTRTNTYRETENREEGIDYTIYQTQKGKFLLHVYDWSRWKNKNSHSRYQIYESLEEIEEAPDKIITEAKIELGEEPVEYLDI